MVSHPPDRKAFFYFKPKTMENQLQLITNDLTRTGLNLPANITKQEWVDYGKRFSELGGAVQWGWGDWWNAGKFEHGERKALVESEEWSGPAYQTLIDYSTVCNFFKNTLRNVFLSYNHHRACLSLPLEESIKILDWAVKNNAGVKATREKVKEVKSWLAQGWDSSQLERKELITNGVTVLANKSQDSALIAWADQQGFMEEIDRTTIYGNPFVMGIDGTRDEVCEAYEDHYLPYKPSILKNIPKLKGKVLVCHCYPERCHGHSLEKLANQ